MKKITIMLLVFLISINSFSQSYVEVGTGTITDGTGSIALPYAPNQDYNYSQNIYYPEDFNKSGFISGIAWHAAPPDTVNNYGATNSVVYLATTSKATFDSGTDWVAISNFTQVYHGSVNGYGDSWIQINFSTPFYYNGVDNLIVAFDDNDTSWNGSNGFYTTDTSGQPRGLSRISQSTNIDPSSPFPGTTQNRIANARFYFDNNDVCPDYESLTVGQTFNDFPIIGKTNVGLSDSGEIPTPTCGNYNGADAWYSLTVPSNGDVTIETNGTSGDTAIEVYSGSCGSLTQIACDDESGNNSFSRINISQPTLAGQTLYIRVWVPNNDATVTYDIAAWSATLPIILGASLNFDGDNDIVQLNPITSVGNNSLTVEAWIKIPNVGTGGLGTTERVGIIFGNYTADPDHDAEFEIHANGEARVYWNDGNVAMDIRGTADLRDNQWHHVAYVRNKIDNTFKFYVDGVLDLDHNSAGSDLTLNNIFYIGGDGRLATGPNFHGNIDELRVWSRALSQSEIVDNMNCELMGIEANLLAYYQFNQGVGGLNNTSETTLVNATSNTAYNGSLINFSLNGGEVSNWSSNAGVTSGSNCGTLGTDEFEVNNETVKIYPNPTNGLISIEAEETIKNIEVFNLVGQQILNIKPNRRRASLDILHLKSGAYFVKVTTNSSFVTNQIIKQ